MTFTYKSAFETYRDCFFVKQQYTNKNLCLEIYGVDEEDDFVKCLTTVTVNIGRLKVNQIAVKNYSENEGLLMFLQTLGLVGEPIRFEQSVFTTVPICELNLEILNKYCVDMNN
jgi:hypothetical protein